MSSSLKVIPSQEGNIVTFKLSGAIDENSDYEQIEVGSASELVFYLKDISLINSLGIQKWVGFFESLKPETKISFVECNARVVNQLTQFSGFTGNRDVTIASVIAPYFCPDCDEEVETLVESKDVEIKEGKPVPPSKKCPSCSAELEFDAVAKKYFAFLLEE